MRIQRLAFLATMTAACLLSSPLCFGAESHVNHTIWKHIAETSGPLVGDREFYSALNLDLPGLENVKAAVAADNYSSAGEALADYFRNRKNVKFFVEPNHNPPRNPAHNCAEPDQALKHIFRGSAIEAYPLVEMGPDIDWTLNPVNDREWTWCLNRHRMWQQLAAAYEATGDEKYAREFNAELNDWVRKCPHPAKGMGADTPTWRTIECGIRLFSVWMQAHNQFLYSPSFTTETRVLFYKSLLEHARFLRQNPSGGNWLTMEMDGLAHVAILFPEFREAEEWKNYAFNRLDKELTIQVYPDGAQTELTNSYHDVALANFITPVKLARLNKVEVPPSYVSKLQKMVDYDLYTMKPNGGHPCFNDSDPQIGTRQEVLHSQPWSRPELLKGVFDSPQDVFCATGGESGRAPEQTSYAFPYAGMFIMRSGWDKDARYLALDAGPFGTGHQHEDKLGFELAAFDRSFIVDPGRYSYADTPLRRFFLTTPAHSTIMVDGKEQWRRHKNPKWPHRVTEPLPNKWVTTPSVDFVEGFYDEGYGQRDPVQVTHRRAVVFVKPDYWIVSDDLQGTGTHRMDSMLHFAPSQVKVDSATGQARTTETDKPSLTVVPFAADSTARPVHLDAEVIEGQQDPVQGWVAFGYGIARKAPTLIYSTTSSLPLRSGYLLYPDRAGVNTNPKLEVLEMQGTQETSRALALSIEHGAVKDYVLFGPGACKPKGLQPIASDANMTLVRRPAKGDGITTIVMVNGSRVSLAPTESYITIEGGKVPFCEVEYEGPHMKITCPNANGSVQLRNSSAVAVNGTKVDVPANMKDQSVTFDKTGKIEFRPTMRM